MNPSTFQSLTETYGPYASWAIWHPDVTQRNDLSVIHNNLPQLHARVVMVALNISDKLTQAWSNFHATSESGTNPHAGIHDRKLVYAFNESLYRGAYMTDLLKGVKDAKSSNVAQMLKEGHLDLSEHLRFFKTEMQAVGADKDTLFLLFGGEVHRLFQKHLGDTFPHALKCKHYAYQYMSDAAYLNELWTHLEIQSRACFEQNKRVMPFQRSPEMEAFRQTLEQKKANGTH